MRLGNVVDEKSSGGGDGQGEKKGMGRSNKGKRSSLDFKVSSYHSNGSPITTKPGKRKNRQQQQQQQYEEEQMKQQQQQTRRPYLSRARGHSGPPPRKWELADLQHMNEEELLQALYADPELAQEAARMAEKIAAEKGSSPSAVPTGTPSRRPTSTPRSKRGSAAGRNGPGEYPDHMRELMDGGVPVIQWLIVLVLLGAAFYQFRKIVSLPDTNQKDVSKRRSRGKGEPKKAKASSNLDNVALAVDVDIQALEVVKSSSKANNNKKAAAATKKQQKVKKEKVNTKNNPAASKAINKKEEEATDDDDSVGSDDAVLPVPAAPVKVAPSARAPVTAPLPTLSTGMTNKDDGSGWQVVSKTTRGGLAEATTVPAEANSSPPSEDVPTSSPSVVDCKENDPLPTTTTALNGKNDHSSKTTKKKQKKGKGKGVDNSNSNNDSNPSSSAAASADNGMDEDAALAQELQREEDNIANKTTSDSANTWEEVATRKRKGTSKPDAATN